MLEWHILGWHVLSSFTTTERTGDHRVDGLWRLTWGTGDSLMIKTEKWAFHLKETACSKAQRLARAQHSQETVWKIWVGVFWADTEDDRESGKVPNIEKSWISSESVLILSWRWCRDMGAISSKELKLYTVWGQTSKAEVLKGTLHKDHAFCLHCIVLCAMNGTDKA